MVRATVVSGGWSTTVQDAGREGWCRYGIPVSGAMDSDGMALANSRAGNPPNRPVLEGMGYLGTLQFHTAANIGLAAPGLRVLLNGYDCSDPSSVRVKPGDQLSVKALPPGFYAYLSVEGRLRCEEWLGSCSTCLPARRGGFRGRCLKRGDVLEWETAPIALEGPEPMRLQPAGPPGYRPVINILPGPEWDSIGEIARMAFLETRLTLSTSLNRTALKLNGSIGLSAKLPSINSSPVFPGVIQWPPGGKPIVVMKDGQTTGGYPRVAAVCTDDLNKLAHGRPGQPLVLTLNH